MVIADAVCIAGIVQRRPIAEESRLSLLLTPRAPRLHRTIMSAQVMPAAEPNRGAPLRARLRGMGANCQEVRRVDSGPASVDDVYVRSPIVGRGVT